MPRTEPATLIDRRLNASIWRKGLSLDDASWQFCPFEIHRRLQEARDPKLMERFSENVRKVTLEKLQALPSLGSALPLEFIDILFKPATIRSEMRDWLQGALRKGKYAAYGDWPPLNPNNPPKLIPQDYFQHGQIDWAKSQLKIGNTEIIAIKVFRLNWVKQENILAVKRVNQSEAKLIGRPTRTVDIQNVLEEMNSAKELNLNRGISKRSLEEIRQRVQLKYPRSSELDNNAGLGDKTLIREIRKFKKGLPKL